MDTGSYCFITFEGDMKYVKGKEAKLFNKKIKKYQETPVWWIEIIELELGEMRAIMESTIDSGERLHRHCINAEKAVKKLRKVFGVI